MPVVRKRLSYEGNFTQIPNNYLRDGRLSLRARGLFALLLSNVEGWKLTVSQLQQDNPEGRDAIRSAILELEEFGYLQREQSRQNGRFDETVWITADPYGLPVTGLPSSEKPTSVNPTHKNTNNKNTKLKKTNKEIYRFDEFWEVYPRKRDKGKAKIAYRAACKKADEETIIVAADRYAKEVDGKEMIYVKYPASWLNAESWANDYEETDQQRREREIRELLESENEE